MSSRMRIDRDTPPDLPKCAKYAPGPWILPERVESSSLRWRRTRTVLVTDIEGDVWRCLKCPPATGGHEWRYWAISRIGRPLTLKTADVDAGDWW